MDCRAALAMTRMAQLQAITTPAKGASVRYVLTASWRGAPPNRVAPSRPWLAEPARSGQTAVMLHCSEPHRLPEMTS